MSHHYLRNKVVNPERSTYLRGTNLVTKLVAATDAGYMHRRKGTEKNGIRAPVATAMLRARMKATDTMSKRWNKLNTSSPPQD
jgi:hypothetical protein